MGYTRNGLFAWAFLPVAILLLLAVLFAQPPSPDALKPKVFVLGLSKTGTTSIGDALERLGYRRLGWRDIRSRHMVHTWANGDLESLKGLTRYYDAFEDLPWPFVYREMAEMYPDAKFLLSLRKDEDRWLRSMRTHVGRGQWMPYTYFYGADTFEGNEEIIRSSYKNHTENVRAFFSDKPERYAELNIDNGDANWDVLCRIAQCPGDKIPSLTFPKSNTVAAWDMGWLVNKLHWTWGWLITRTEELASDYYYRKGGTLWRPILHFCWSIYDFVEAIYSEIYFRVIPFAFPTITA